MNKRTSVKQSARPSKARNSSDPIVDHLNELAKIKFVLDSSVIIDIADPQGIITYVNDRYCELTQWTREEILSTAQSFIHPLYQSKSCWQALWKTIRAGRIWRGEVSGRTKTGQVYWVYTTIVPFIDDSGKPYQYIAIRYDITKRKEMEVAVQALPQRIIQAQEEERARISSDIHDDLGQALATLKMKIQAARQRWLEMDPSVSTSCDHILNDLNDIIEKTRSLASGLRPTTLEVLGVKAALQALVDEFRIEEGLQINFSCPLMHCYGFKGEVINLYRIVQEALTNIVRHSEASEVDIIFKVTDDRLNMRIEDNGKGFKQTGKMQACALGLGLSTMKERTQLLSGTMQIKSSPQKGTVIILDIPVMPIVEGDSDGV